MHTGALEPCFDDILIGAFHYAAADGPSGLGKRRVKHLGLALVEIGEVAGQQFKGGVLCLLRPQFSEHRLRAFMFEAVQPCLCPRLRLAWSGAEQGLPDFTDALRRMGEIQNTGGMRTMMIHNTLQPVSAIHDRSHLRAVFNPAFVGFDQRQARKLLC